MTPGTVPVVSQNIYRTEAATFGSDVLTRGAALTGISDGTDGTFSCWYSVATGGTFRNFLALRSSGETPLNVRLTDTDYFEVRARDSSPAQLLVTRTAISTGLYGTGSGWHHVLCSWRINSTPYIYVDGVDVLSATPTNTPGSIDYTGTDAGVGGDPGGFAYFDGDLTELWFDTVYVDVSDANVRRRFLNGIGKPEFLGSDGSRPFGAIPKIYVKGNAANIVANRGGGGGFTLTGTLTDASTSPSD